RESTSHTAVTLQSECSRNAFITCIPRPPTPIKPSRTGSASRSGTPSAPTAVPAAAKAARVEWVNVRREIFDIVFGSPRGVGGGEDIWRALPTSGRPHSRQRGSRRVTSLLDGNYRTKSKRLF